MKVIGIVGSLRKDSYNLRLANIIKDKLDIEMEIVDISNIPFFNEDIEYPAPYEVKELRDKVRYSDALWIFSPEYNNSYSGVLKNTIDWLSRPIDKETRQVLSDKKVILSGTTMGPFGTINAYNDLVKLFVMLNANLMTKPRLTIPDAINNVNHENKFIEDAVRHASKFIKK